MQVRWRVYRFNYNKYIEIRPTLRAAPQAADLESLSESPELDSLVVRIADGKTSPANAIQTFVISLCCCGAPVYLDRRFVRTVKSLSNSQSTRQIGETLHSIVRGSANIEPWLASAAGGPLQGFLTTEQTAELHSLFRPHMERLRLHDQGLVHGLRHILRLLLNHDFDRVSTLRSIAEQLATAQENGEGIAVVSV